MKTTRLKFWMGASAAVLTAGAGLRVWADPASPAAVRAEKHYTGMIVSVDPAAHTLKAKGFIFSKRFNFGADCNYVLLDKASGTAADLQPGEKVAIRYQDADGVLVADRVKQLAMRYTGMVKAVDPASRTLTLHLFGRDKTFQVSGDCAVALRDDKAGSLADVQTGDHVTVTYDKPGGRLVATQIAETSRQFTGTLTAIDLDAKTLKAQTPFSSKRFTVGDHCAIVINGKPDGRLSDLKPDERLDFSYDDINGVNVVNRIAPAKARAPSVAANTGIPKGY